MSRTRAPLATYAIVASLAAALPIAASAQGSPGRKAAAPLFAQKNTAPASAKAEDPTRQPYTPEEMAKAQLPGIEGGRFFADSVGDFRAAIAPAAKRGGPWLVLSGGGEGGAFGAGLLNGWTKSGSRPTFSVVTGSSTGALIAPLAFAGSKYDDALKAAYTDVSAGDIFEFGATPQSLLDTWPFQRLIERFVTPELLADIAEGHREGRRLFVLTTNVDGQRPVAWDLGAIAAAEGPNALKLFRKVLMASSAIPGLFPPVGIELEAEGKVFKEMHVDGSVAAPFYIVPEAVIAKNIALPELQRTMVYVVVNNNLAPEFQYTDKSTVDVLGRALSVGMKTATRVLVAATRSYADTNGVDLAFASFDDTVAPPSTGLFNRKYMNALYEIGQNAALQGGAFAPEARTPEPPASAGAPEEKHARATPQPFKASSLP